MTCIFSVTLRKLEWHNSIIVAFKLTQNDFDIDDVMLSENTGFYNYICLALLYTFKSQSLYLKSQLYQQSPSLQLSAI